MQNKELRILYLLWFPFYGSGSGTYARYLAREINKTHTVAVVTPDTRPIDGVKLYPLKMPFRVAFTGHPEWPDCKLFTAISHRDILRLHKSSLDSVVDAVEDFRPNIIHVHHAYPLSWTARFVKSTYQIPYIITVHGSELPSAQKDKRYIALTNDALRRAKRIIPNSAYTKDWSVKVFGDEFKKNMRVIPGGVDIKRFHKVDKSAIAEELGVKGKKVVLFAGKLTKYKGVKYLIRAASKIHGEVVISGNGPEKKYLLQMVKDLKLMNVHFAGHVDNTDRLVQLYSLADVFVAPSVWDEPLGLVILESMACETPVVVTRKGGIPLAVKDGKNGFFVKPRNATDIVEKVNKLLDNDALRAKLGQTARKIAVERFSWDSIAGKFNNMYEKYT